MGREKNLIVVAFDCSYSQFHIAGCLLQSKAEDIISLATCVFECVLISDNLARQIDRALNCVFNVGEKLLLHIKCAADTKDIRFDLRLRTEDCPAICAD